MLYELAARKRAFRRGSAAETIYFPAGDSVWSVASGGGDARRICAGDVVVPKPAVATLVIARLESSQVRLFEVPAQMGPNGRSR